VRAGYEVALSARTGRRDERQAVDTLLDYRCEAAILLGSELSAELESLGERLLVVSVGRPAVGAIGAIRTDDAQGIEQVVEHLVELGRRDLAHVDGGTGPIADERRAGFRRAVSAHRLTRRSTVVRGGRTEDGRAAAETLLARSKRPTAVVAYNDACALGVMEELAAASLDVPGDVAVTGYDDSMISRLSVVDLTSVSQEAVA
jgi:DNA-binding LacI/PurR family transcriptional regulator